MNDATWPTDRTAGVYEPHCLMTWAEMCAGMDDMGGIATTKPTTEYSKNYSGAHDKPPTEAACTS
jgi:hypothetical protein